MMKKMETKTQEKSGLTRRKTSQIVKFCAKDERNASLKKVSTILQKAENERTLEEQQVLSEYSEIVADLKLRWHRRDEAKRRVEEVEEPLDVLDEKCRVLAQALAQSEHLVVYTGAGISTAARIPDYRGSNGIWTRLREGKDIGNHDLSLAEPTFTHMSLSSLYHHKKLKYIVSQNCDGLHLRSGLPRSALSELHGNMYIEVCKKCQPVREYWRLFDVTENTARFSHKTMRRCYICNSDLMDTIVHFGERGTLQWPLNWSGACKNADDADTILCLGSSLKVLKRYPWLWQMNKPAKKRPNLYIVNLQWTPKDDCAVMKINGKCDNVMTRVMKLLGVNVPGYTRERDPIFAHASLLCELEMHTTNQPSLKMLESDENVEINGKTEENLVKIEESLAKTEESKVITGQSEVKSEHSEIRTETSVKIEKSEVKAEKSETNEFRTELSDTTSVGTEHNIVNPEKANDRINQNEVKTEETEVKLENVIGTEHDTTRTEQDMVETEHNLIKTETGDRNAQNELKTEHNMARTELSIAKIETGVKTIQNEIKTEQIEVKFEPHEVNRESECEIKTSTSNFKISEKPEQEVVQSQNLEKHELKNGIKQENGVNLNNIDNNINFLQEQNEAFDLTVKRDISCANINTHTNIKTARLSQNGSSSINCTQSEQIAIPKRKTQEKNPFSIDSILNKDTVAKPANNVANGSNYQTIMAYYEFANSLLQNQMLNYFTSGLYPFQTSVHYPGFHSIVNPMPYFNYDFSGNTSINRQIKIEKIVEKPSVPSCEFCHKTFASFSCLYYSKTHPEFKKQLFRFSKIKNFNKELVCLCCDYTTEEEDSDSDSSEKKKLKSDKIEESRENIDETNICEDEKETPEKISEKNEPKKVQAGWFGKGYRKNRKPKKKQYSNSR